MPISLVSPPSVLPISLSEAKNHLRVETADDDAYITELMEAAVDYLQRSTDLKLITQTWRQYCEPAAGSSETRIKARPVQNIAEITVYDASGNPTIILPSEYEFSRYGDLPMLHILAPPGAVSVEIDFIAGYGDAALDVPDTLKRALLLLVSHWYEFRGAVAVEDHPVSLPSGFETLLAPFNRIGI